MKRTEILLTLLASTTLVLVVACGGKQEASPTLPERALPSSQPAVSPAPPPLVVTRTVVVTQPPPLPLQETMTIPPSSVSVWVPGYWSWNNGWQWVAGHWELPPQRMSAWVPGQWMSQGQDWVWLPGHWQ